jgi:hypothetical protein
MAQMDADDIIVIAESASVAAIKEYERISNRDHNYMPEYWITCRVASDLANKGWRVECEKRIEELIPKHVEGRNGRRIDLAIYDNVTADRSYGSLKALLEVKGPGSTWPTFPADFVRLRIIAKLLDEPGLLIGLVWGSNPMTDGQLDFAQMTMRQLFSAEIPGRERSDFVKVSQRQRLQFHHSNRTLGEDDAWEVMSIFDRT